MLSLRSQFKSAKARPLFRYAVSTQQTRFCSSSTLQEPIINPSPSSQQHDHHTLGKRLDLFSTVTYSQGSPLLHEDGSHLFFKLQSFLPARYKASGFRRVITPTIFTQALWEKSGHWQNYAKDIFEIKGKGQDEETRSFKPMNCPGHCLLFARKSRSYHDLPIRFAEFGPLYRDEASGSLSGLTRMVQFHQDDGHIFCRPDQVESEIASTLQMMKSMYSVFGLKPHNVLLSTRPESYIGNLSEWNAAESQLRSSLDNSGLSWSLNPGDGAFYGPKIDITLRDNHGKEHQTATIQLDFQLPQRFELQYKHFETGAQETPIMIHRAVFGSIERFMALLIEHYGGKWPFWLNPRQIAVLTMNQDENVLEWAQHVADSLSEKQEFDTIDINKAGQTLNKKLKLAREQGYGIACVVGRQEAEERKVSVSLLFDTGADTGKSEILEGIVKEVLPAQDLTALAWKEKRQIVTDLETLKALVRRIDDHHL